MAKLHSVVPNSPLDKLQQATVTNFERYSKLFQRGGTIDKHNRVLGIHYGRELDAIRRGGGESRRGFGSETGVAIDEYVSAAYGGVLVETTMKLSSGQPVTRMFERLAVYRQPRRGVLALLHIVDFGTDLGPSSEIDDKVDRGIVFEPATKSVKYMDTEGENGLFWQEYSGTDPTLDVLRENFVDQEFHELGETHFSIGTRRVDRLTRHGRSVLDKVDLIRYGFSQGSSKGKE